MNYFPAFLDTSNKRVLICGSGAEAERKIKILGQFGFDIHIISENGLTGDFGDVIIHRHSFSESDLSVRPIMVVAACSEQENIRIAQICRRHNVLINCVDMPAECDFIFPAMTVTENLCLAVSTGGKSPGAAVALRNQLSRHIPADIDGILDWLWDFREGLRAEFDDKRLINSVLKEAVACALDRGEIPSAEMISQILASVVG